MYQTCWGNAQLGLCDAVLEFHDVVLGERPHHTRLLLAGRGWTFPYSLLGMDVLQDFGLLIDALRQQVALI